MQKQQRGVTLIELIMSVALIGSLLTMGLPSFFNFTQRTQMVTAKNELLSVLQYARSTAVTSGKEVVLCPTIDQENCADSMSWHQGWILFADENRNDKRDGSETVLSVGGDVSKDLVIVSSQGRKKVVYRTDGSATGTNLTFTFCDRRGAESATTLVVNNGGRVRQGVPTTHQAATACSSLSQ